MNVFETKRLHLRHLKTSDLEDLYQLISDSEVMRYYPHQMSLDEAEEWIQRSKRNIRDRGHSFYACIHKQSKEFVGISGLVPPGNAPGTIEVELGYLLNRRFWNQGFATEAAFGCLDYGFSHFSFEKLVSIIDPENHASIRVAEKNGLAFESKTYRFDKTMLVYSITKEVWEAHAYSRAG